MALTLHWNLVSQPCRATKHLLDILNLEHVTKDYDIFVAAHKKDEFFQKISPTGLLPTLQEGDDWATSESNAIFYYLLNTRDVPESLYPKNDARKRVDHDMLLAWNQATCRNAYMSVFRGIAKSLF